MFADCNINQIPTVNNIEEIIVVAAKYVFVQGCFLLCQKSLKEWVPFGMVSQQPTLMYYGIHINQQCQTV